MSATGWWAEVFLVVRPNPAVLHFTGGSPILLSGKRILATAAALTVTGSSPTVVVTQHRIVQPSPAVLTIIGSRPVQGTSARPVTGGLTVTGGTPTVTLSDNKTVQPSAAALTITGSAPEVSATANQFPTPAAASLTITGGVPVVTASDHKQVQPAAASLTITGGTPTAGVGLTFIPTGASLTVTMATPTVTATTNKFITPTNAALTITGGQPVVSTPRLVTPTGASLTVTGGTPTVTVASTGAHYTDDFNRADNASLGASWTNRSGSGQLKILSNTAAIPVTSTFYQSSYASGMASDDHSVSVTIGSTVPSEVYLYVRSSNSQQILMDAPSGAAWAIYTGSGTYAAFGITSRATSGVTSFAAGDVILAQAVGNVYTLKKNGATVLTWTDTGGATYGANVNSSHREVGFGMQSTTANSKVDNFTADDI